jgi:dienelactone hydrolase
MAVKTRNLIYAADGLSMRSTLAWESDATGARPGVLVFPEGFGLGEHARAKALRLAQAGYVTLACDLHGDATVIDDMGVLMPKIGALLEAPGRIRERAMASLQALRSQPEVDGDRLAAIGYCFGGTMALELVRGGAPVAGAAGFHCGLTSRLPLAPATTQAKVFVCIGADDPLVTPADRGAFEAEMRQAKADWRMHVYGGVVHSFTNPEAAARGAPDALRYDAGADARSWNELRAFLEEVLR